jgi:hypothetical protein
LVERYAADPVSATLTDEEVAWLALGVADVIARDAVLAEAAASGEQSARLRTVLEPTQDPAIGSARPDLGTYLALFSAVARRTGPPVDPPICAVLGWCAYLAGNGALALVACERARETDPDYSLARLLDDALYQQVEPAVLRQAWLGAQLGGGTDSTTQI